MHRHQRNIYTCQYPCIFIGSLTSGHKTVHKLTSIKVLHHTLNRTIMYYSHVRVHER